MSKGGLQGSPFFLIIARKVQKLITWNTSDSLWNGKDKWWDFISRLLMFFQFYLQKTLPSIHKAFHVLLSGVLERQILSVV